MPTRRTVLAVVHSVVTGARLADVLPVLASDWRIQVVFTAAPSLFSVGVRDFLHDMGAVVVPWQQAVREPFDLAIAAGTGQLERLHAPVLLMPHGVGYGKLPASWQAYGLKAPRHAHGTERQQLVYHGRVVPAGILLAHRGRLAQLRRSCPEAVPAAVIVGDPCHDRLVASLPLRDAYRRAMQVRNGQRLVLVTSTWGPRSLLGQDPGILARLVSELPADRYRVAVSLHPDAWDWHGSWQVKAWTENCLRSGMTLLPAAEGWRAALVATDLVIGDHGSVTFYAASLGVPVVLAAFPDQDVDPSSHVALLGKTAPRLDQARPLLPQLEHFVAAYRPGQYAKIRGQISSVPGQSRQIIRQVIYRHLGLPEPDGVPRTDPVPLPTSRLPLSHRAFGSDGAQDGVQVAC
ncbi:MAG: hypothetical protein J2P25_05200 [Nocardiopsaceae bacterium]|nr:hypothetical protein [Nocardiopsaceae bacterium]